MESKKPALAILIGQALAKKGKAKPMDEEESTDESEDGGVEERMQQIAEEILDAIKSHDATALASLLCEAIECYK